MVDKMKKDFENKIIKVNLYIKTGLIKYKTK